MSDLRRTLSQTLSGLTAGSALPLVDTGPDRSQTIDAQNPLLHRSSTTRLEGRTVVQERIRTEAAQTIRVQMRSQIRMAMPLIVLVMISVVVVVFISILLTVRAFWATMQYWDFPCDQPLRYYVIVSWGYGSLAEKLINPKMRPLLQQRFGSEPWQMFVYACVTAVPSWIIFGWGMGMVNKCHTCQDTSPILYSCIKDFIRFQIFAACIYFFIAYIFFLLAHRLMLRLMSINPVQSCVQSVEKLPQLEQSSSLLLDPDDGQVKDCCICLGALAGPSVVVKTPCEHLFHLDCLKAWAKAHVDCPLCRAPIGEVDKNEADATCDDLEASPAS
mmetsp:Transcript_30830/g.70733  ORF Transcript_30830/g.70733 Transcript_30830/m.70733 type:complete len:330 (+) Transcript_30830:100-1089(+)